MGTRLMALLVVKATRFVDDRYGDVKDFERWPKVY
jgi:hypothetical protein